MPDISDHECDELFTTNASSRRHVMVYRPSLGPVEKTPQSEQQQRQREEEMATWARDQASR